MRWLQATKVLSHQLNRRSLIIVMFALIWGWLLDRTNRVRSECRPTIRCLTQEFFWEPRANHRNHQGELIQGSPPVAAKLPLRPECAHSLC